MTRRKGAIALDIDGTITDALHEIPRDVAHFLKSLSEEGWQILFITGRTFVFALSALKTLEFPYILAVQNGADILHMPQRKCIHRSYLTGKELALIDNLYKDREEDFILYAGMDEGDFCYYRPHRFSPKALENLEKVKALCFKPWIAVESFEGLFDQEFPLAKGIGNKEEMLSLYEEIKLIPSLEVSLIRDVVGKGLYLNLITSLDTAKGKSLEKIIALEKITGPIIAAGDDRNDLCMLKRADISITMKNAPEELLEMADIIAPSVSEKGIIQGLQQAIAQVGK